MSALLSRTFALFGKNFRINAISSININRMNKIDNYSFSTGTTRTFAESADTEGSIGDYEAGHGQRKLTEKLEDKMDQVLEKVDNAWEKITYHKDDADIAQSKCRSSNDQEKEKTIFENETELERIEREATTKKQ